MSESQKTSSMDAESTQHILKQIGNADFFHILKDNEFFESYIKLAQTLWDTSNFSLRERELIILNIASELSNKYIWKHHTPIALNNGVKIYELGSIERYVSLDDVREDAILNTVTSIINKERVSVDILNKDEIQSLIGIVGFYSWLDYYTTSLGLKIGQKEW